VIGASIVMDASVVSSVIAIPRAGCDRASVALIPT
jgi:hypothetical protein